MATMRRKISGRDLRLPGQSLEYKDHPSNVGSPSYFADTGRGWVPNKRNIGGDNRRPSDRQPGIGVANRRTGPSFGFDRAGAARGDISPFVSNQANIERANRRGIASLDEDEGMGLWGHTKKALRGFNFGDFPMPKMMKMAGDTFSDAMRGSALHSSYKDAAVAEGRSKAAGSKDWERDKRLMMTDEEKAFEKKYMNLYERTGDEAHKDTAESAWRNKQTSDRLAAATGFEGYAPSKYTGVGEGSRYTGDAYEDQGRTGKFVPGVGIMDEILNRLYPGGEGYDMDFGGPLTPAGGPISITDNRNIDLGGPLTPAGGPILEEDITEDITADVGGLLPAGMPLMPNQQMRYEPLAPAGMNAGVDWGRYELPQKRGFQGDPVMSEWQDLSWRDSDSPVTRTFGVNKIPAMGSKFDEGDRYYNAYDLANMDEEEETFIKPKTNLRGRLGLYD